MPNLAALDSGQPAQSGFAGPVSVRREGCMLGRGALQSRTRQRAAIASGGRARHRPEADDRRDNRRALQQETLVKCPIKHTAPSYP